MGIAKKFGDQDNYSIYQLNGKMGLAGSPNGGSQQIIITQPIFDIIYPFIDGYAIVINDKKKGVINKFGEITIPFDNINLTYEKDKRAFLIYKYGIDPYYVDGNNNSLNIPVTNERDRNIIKKFLGIDDPLAKSYKNKNIIYGKTVDYNFLYNVTLNQIIYKNYSIARIINENKIIVQDRDSNKYGIIDLNGNILVNFIYDNIFFNVATNEDSVENNLIPAIKNNKAGYIDFWGNIMIPFIYKYVGLFINGKAWVSKEDGKTGIINIHGNVIEPLIHDNIIDIDDNMYALIDEDPYWRTEKYSILKGGIKIVINNKGYTSLHFRAFNNPDLIGFSVSRGKYSIDAYGVMNLNGKELIPPIYSDFWWGFDWENGIVARKNGKYGIIDISNKTLLKFEFDNINCRNVMINNKPYSFFIVYKNGKFGVINYKFMETIPLIYDSINFNERYNSFVVKIGKESAMVDHENNIIIPFTNHYIDWC